MAYPDKPTLSDYREKILSDLFEAAKDPRKLEHIICSLSGICNCEKAINDLWRDIILKRCPHYGDWGYAAEAYRHLLAEFQDKDKEIAKLQAQVECLKNKNSAYQVFWKLNS